LKTQKEQKGTEEAKQSKNQNLWNSCHSSSTQPSLHLYHKGPSYFRLDKEKKNHYQDLKHN